jgi:basic membrane protein A
MNLKKWRVFSALLIVLAMVAASCSDDEGGACENASDDDVLAVGFIHVGPVADKGWSWAHDQGAEFLKAELGNGVSITTLENIAEGADSQRVIEDLAAQGCELIFGTTFGYMEPMVAASAKMALE